MKIDVGGSSKVKTSFVCQNQNQTLESSSEKAWGEFFFFYIDYTENLNISTEVLLNEKLPSQVREFSAGNCPN